MEAYVSFIQWNQQLLEVADLCDSDRPDERSVMTYVASYFHAFSSQGPYIFHAPPTTVVTYPYRSFYRPGRNGFPSHREVRGTHAVNLG
jgi:hypothetical protein